MAWHHQEHERCGESSKMSEKRKKKKGPSFFEVVFSIKCFAKGNAPLFVPHFIISYDVRVGHNVLSNRGRNLSQKKRKKTCQILLLLDKHIHDYLCCVRAFNEAILDPQGALTCLWQHENQIIGQLCFAHPRIIENRSIHVI